MESVPIRVQLEPTGTGHGERLLLWINGELWVSTMTFRATSWDAAVELIEALESRPERESMAVIGEWLRSEQSGNVSEAGS